MDRDITISGVLALKKQLANPSETDESKQKTEFISLTEPLELKIQGKNNNIINVPSQSGAAGYDYRSAQ